MSKKPSDHDRFRMIELDIPTENLPLVPIVKPDDRFLMLEIEGVESMVPPKEPKKVTPQIIVPAPIVTPVTRTVTNQPRNTLQASLVTSLNKWIGMYDS